MIKPLFINRLSVWIEVNHQSLALVEDLTFELQPGKTIALLGESGCGKSMTALALMRLLPLNMSYGIQSQVIHDDQDLLDLPENIMRQLRGKKVAIIFQEPMTALNPVLTIQQQLEESLPREHRSSRKKSRQKMIELLTEVEISEPEMRLSQYPHQLSGGQKQRIIIAMALARRPNVLIADEPTTALDSNTQTQILSLLKRLQVQYQMSILLITHDLEVVKQAADEVYMMYAGQLVEASPVMSFLNDPKHPYAQQLLQSLPAYEKRGQRLPAIAGSVPTIDTRPKACRFHPRCAHVFEKCREIEPLLQTLPNGCHVRCHLYPEHSAPPELAHQTLHYPNEKYIREDEIILSVHDLLVYFYPKHHLFGRKGLPFKAVDGISFDLYKGKTLALVGDSGCGKTTVCKSILKLQPITGGDIQYRGQSISSLHGRSLRAFRKHVQIIFQDPFSSMNPRMTIGAILAEGMEAQGMKSSNLKRRQMELLDYVNLSKTSLSRYPHQFSGGQRQRICIARALATNPEILVCDEPTSALDISVQAQILNVLKTLQYELGLSYLFITHNMKVVDYFADDILMMQNGRAVERKTLV